MAWTCINASGKGSLIFIVDVTYDDNSSMNSEVYRNVLSLKLQRSASNLIRRRFIMQHELTQNTLPVYFLVSDWLSRSLLCLQGA